jgi:hypothetical protein
MEFITEFIAFLRVRKKYFLIPVILILFLIAGLMVLTGGSALAPFIYTLF